jgi:hypothetical protein
MHMLAADAHNSEPLKLLQTRQCSCSVEHVPAVCFHNVAILNESRQSQLQPPHSQVQKSNQSSFPGQSLQQLCVATMVRRTPGPQGYARWRSRDGTAVGARQRAAGSQSQAGSLSGALHMHVHLKQPYAVLKWVLMPLIFPCRILVEAVNSRASLCCTSQTALSKQVPESRSICGSRSLHGSRSAHGSRSTFGSRRAHGRRHARPSVWGEYHRFLKVAGLLLNSRGSFADPTYFPALQAWTVSVTAPNAKADSVNRRMRGPVLQRLTSDGSLAGGLHLSVAELSRVLYDARCVHTGLMLWSMLAVMPHAAICPLPDWPFEHVPVAL